MTSRIKTIIEFLNKAFLPFHRNSKNSHGVYACKLVEASASNLYVENVSNKTDRLHDRIKGSYEECFAGSYACVLENLKKALRPGQSTIAIDITHEDFYGKISGLDIIPKNEDGKTGEFQYAVLSMVNKAETEKFPVYALPFRLGQSKARTVEQLLNIAWKLLPRIKLVLLDRGFYSAEVLDLLNKQVKYLMLVPKYAVFRCMLEQLKADDKTIEYVNHELVLKKDFSHFKIKTKLILINNQAKYDWVFATNLPNDKALYYIITYKRRWQIETNFRVEDEARIRSRSPYLQVRYFYFLISLLLHALWVIKIRTERIPFAVFLHWLDRMLLFEQLGIDYIWAGPSF